jgi:hypothetical protein
MRSVLAAVFCKIPDATGKAFAYSILSAILILKY